jgi:hypothetical protein
MGTLEVFLCSKVVEGMVGNWQWMEGDPERFFWGHHNPCREYAPKCNNQEIMTHLKTCQLNAGTYGTLRSLFMTGKNLDIIVLLARTCLYKMLVLLLKQPCACLRITLK